MYLMHLNFDKYLKDIKPKLDYNIPMYGINYDLELEPSRYLSPDDFNLKVDLHTKIFNPTYDVLENLNGLKKSFSSTEGCGFILKVNGVIVGSVDYDMVYDFVYILNLGLIDEFRGKGLSKVLLSFCIDRIIDKYYAKYDGVYLTVKKSNYVAQNLYNSFGFEVKC